MHSRGKSDTKSGKKSDAGPQYLVLRDRIALNIEMATGISGC